jgi:hypothetical protein
MAPISLETGSADRHKPTPLDDEEVASSSSSDSYDAQAKYVREEDLVKLFTLYAEQLNAKAAHDDLQRVVELVANLSDSVLKLESRILALEGLVESYSTSNTLSSSCWEAQNVDISDLNDEEDEDENEHVAIHPDDQKMMLECLANAPDASDTSRRLAAEILLHDQAANRKKNKSKKEKIKKAAAVRSSRGSESCAVPADGDQENQQS